jgi:hypothetical protein
VADYLVDADGPTARFADHSLLEDVGVVCGRPATAPTTAGSRSRGWWCGKAMSCTAAASPAYLADRIATGHPVGYR